MLHFERALTGFAKLAGDDKLDKNFYYILRRFGMSKREPHWENRQVPGSRFDEYDVLGTAVYR